LFSYFVSNLYLVLIARLLLACILGGIIGYERESTNRPAGFRTHILVCVGSALVMITSEFIFKKYNGLTSIDPTRLGAQVISGIGFLGAGTIIREGFSVKGLTTAASLWAVSCVGLAAGIGFYEGALAATALIYITLILLKRMEDHFSKKEQYRVIYIKADESQNQILNINKVIDKHGVMIKKIEIINGEVGKELTIKLLVKLPVHLSIVEFIGELHQLDGVTNISEG
jgi:putative Mg2+ transporter-C (MgtC) family protein